MTKFEDIEVGDILYLEWDDCKCIARVNSKDKKFYSVELNNIYSSKITGGCYNIHRCYMKKDSKILMKEDTIPKGIEILVG